MNPKFGGHHRQYVLGRRDYPELVFSYLKIHVDVKETLLDVGCGTGISTRQLVRAGFEDVQGIDEDEEMLEEAMEHKAFKHISYYLAPANKIPFRNASFKALTCFSSFHWFADAASLREMKRVLEKKGVLFIVDKLDTQSLKKEVQEQVEQFLGLSFPKIMPFADFEPLLIKHNFQMQPVKKFEGEDRYSLQEALAYIQSTSYWSWIPQERQIVVLDNVVKPFLEKKLRTSIHIVRKYEAACLLAIKAT